MSVKNPVTLGCCWPLELAIASITTMQAPMMDFTGFSDYFAGGFVGSGAFPSSTNVNIFGVAVGPPPNPGGGGGGAGAFPPT